MNDLFCFKQEELNFYLCNKSLKKAVDYLTMFPEKNQLTKRYLKIIKRKRISNYHLDSKVIEVLNFFINYFINELYYNNDNSQQLLLNDLNIFFNTCCLTIEEIEEQLEKFFKQFGYYFLGGTVDGVYSPLIWSETEEKWFDVKLVSQSFKVKVMITDKYIFKSWLDYLSFNKIGINNWSCQNGIFLVKKKYLKSFDKPKFTVSLLKHYAQYELDTFLYPGLVEKDKIYRVKLIELIYYPNISKLKTFYYQANDDNNDHHAYSSFIIIKRLSMLLFNVDYVKKFDYFKGKVKEVQKHAKMLYLESDEIIKNTNTEVIEII